MKRLLACALCCAACQQAPDVVATAQAGDGAVPDAAAPEVFPLTGALDVHDPSATFDGQQFWIFSTGAGIPIKVSSDLLAWSDEGAAFAQSPAWVAQQVPTAEGLWSPDVAFFGGEYHLYYAASTFGADRSCIGHATSTELGAGTWTDQGMVICSNTGTVPDDWNAIDPNVLVTDDGNVWMVFGSYLSGIKLIRLDDTGARADTTLVSIAARPDADNMVQAAALAYHGGFFYLFVSFGTCCMGVNSTHQLMVGRATSVDGPYVDRAGRRMLDGGGTLVLDGDARWRGPGSNDVLVRGERTYNVYHAYDADNAGRATLRIATLTWDDAGWPISGGP